MTLKDFQDKLQSLAWLLSGFAIIFSGITGAQILTREDPAAIVNTRLNSLETKIADVGLLVLERCLDKDLPPHMYALYECGKRVSAYVVVTGAPK